jgi:hypothetical protein
MADPSEIGVLDNESGHTLGLEEIFHSPPFQTWIPPDDSRDMHHGPNGQLGSEARRRVDGRLAALQPSPPASWRLIAYFAAVSNCG